MSATTDKFKKLLDKYPERRIKTLDRMRSLIASHCLAREFGETIESLYERRPDMQATDEGLKDLIIEYEGFKDV